MAITECPEALLKTVSSDRINAGRFLWASRSEKGNGTRTTLKRS